MRIRLPVASLGVLISSLASIQGFSQTLAENHRKVSPQCRQRFSTGLASVETAVQLQSAILESFSQNYPYWGVHGATDLFYTSFDYHSSVHAHWALLTMARANNDDALDEAIQDRFSDEVLDKEREFLQTSPHQAFELPYGRAWLLLLLRELSLRDRFKDSIALAEFQNFLEAQLMDHLAERVLPERGDRGFSGLHQSWLFSLLLFSQGLPESSQNRDSIKAEIDRALQYEEKIRSTVPEEQAFGFPFGLFATLDRLQSVGEGSSIYAFEVTPDLPPIGELNSHLVGLEVTRNWPHAVLSHYGNRESCLFFESQMNRLMNRPDTWQLVYRGAQHWVPQFIWAGMMLERLGRLTSE